MFKILKIVAEFSCVKNMDFQQKVSAFGFEAGRDAGRDASVVIRIQAASEQSEKLLSGKADESDLQIWNCHSEEKSGILMNV